MCLTYMDYNQVTHDLNGFLFHQNAYILLTILKLFIIGYHSYDFDLSYTDIVPIIYYS